jgi:hypothetical protein
MSYSPQVNDYVKWKRGVEGWIYFKCNQYITIEQSVRPKDCENYQACSLHRNERLLVLCYEGQWKELTYVKSRKSVYEKGKKDLEILGESIGGESI